MPFQSYQELIDMSSRDPKMAMMYVKKANALGKPVVDENNPGYGNRPKPPGSPKKNVMMDAVQRRMKRQTGGPTRQSKTTMSGNNDDEHDYR